MQQQLRTGHLWGANATRHSRQVGSTLESAKPNKVRKTRPSEDPNSTQRRARDASRSSRSVNGQRHAWPGRKPRRPEPSSPAVDQRQSLAFDHHVDGRSLREIGKLLGIDRSTVATDIAMEGQRRARELKHQREAQIAMAVTRYEGVILQANNKIAELTDQLAAEYAAARSRIPSTGPVFRR